MPRAFHHLNQRNGWIDPERSLAAAVIKEHLVTGEAVAHGLSDGFSHARLSRQNSQRDGGVEKGVREQPHTSAVETYREVTYYVDKCGEGN